LIKRIVRTVIPLLLNSSLYAAAPSPWLFSTHLSFTQVSGTEIEEAGNYSNVNRISPFTFYSGEGGFYKKLTPLFSFHTYFSAGIGQESPEYIYNAVLYVDGMPETHDLKLLTRHSSVGGLCELACVRRIHSKIDFFLSGGVGLFDYVKSFALFVDDGTSLDGIRINSDLEIREKLTVSPHSGVGLLWHLYPFIDVRLLYQFRYWQPLHSTDTVIGISIDRRETLSNHQIKMGILLDWGWSERQRIQ